jgi:curved DNA-binding protein CbpA
MKNYYQILEVPPDALQEIIKEQYFFLVQAWHPDKFAGSAQKIKAEEKIKEVNEAYGVLSNPIKRAEYDGRIHLAHTSSEQENNKQTEAKSSQGEAEEKVKRHDPPTITVPEIVRAWRQISFSLMDKHYLTAALLNSVKMIDLDGSTLILGFASEIVASKMNPEETERTRNAICNVLVVRLKSNST